MSKRLRFIALCLATLMMAGCTGSVPTTPRSAPSLPPPDPRYPAPSEDSTQDYAQTVQLCLPSQENGQLIMVQERLLLPPDRHPAEATLTKLLSFAGNEQAKPLFPEASLQLQPGWGVELSGDVVTIHLSTNARLLSRQNLFTLRRAIANTLVQWGDIHYISVLVDGTEPGVDEAGLLPMGLMEETRNEDAPALWNSYAARFQSESPESQRFSSLCALYFPAPSGRGVLTEARAVSFPGQSQQQMVISLLEALSAGAQTLPRLPVMPNLVGLLAAAPQVVDSANGLGRVAHLQFLETTNQALIQAGIPRSIMLASLTYTLCTFLPGLQGLAVQIGNEHIEAIVPSGIYDGAGEQIFFSGGVLRRADFSSFLLTDCTLYLTNAAQSLVRVRRPVPHALAHSMRYLLGQLMEGPQVYDSIQSTSPVFPSGIDQEALIAVAREGDTALINFSQELLDRAVGMTPQQERLMVYAIVNTLCESPSTSRVRFFIEGGQPDTFAGAVYLPGEFLRNPELIAR